jgi:mercuric ion binding protein
MRRLLLSAALALFPLAALAGIPQTVTLDVKNMTCALCPITVRKALEKVPGVSDAKVDFEVLVQTAKGRHIWREHPFGRREPEC